MSGVFRVWAKGDDSTVCYALTSQSCEALADTIRANGFIPVTKELQISQVPTKELSILRTI